MLAITLSDVAVVKRGIAQVYAAEASLWTFVASVAALERTSTDVAGIWRTSVAAAGLRVRVDVTINVGQ